MLSRCCTACGETKPITDFHRSGRGTVAKCKRCRSAIRKKWRESSPTYQQVQARLKRKWRLSTYGLAPADYDFLLTAQGGGCAMCGGSCPTGKRLAVDHDHATGQVRGLLCLPCNRKLGSFEKIREQAEMYLNRAPLLVAYVAEPSKETR